MKTIQKLTLGLLTVVASSAGFSATDLTLNVASAGESAEVSGALTATNIHKTGAGQVILSASNTISTLEIANGCVQINHASALPAAAAGKNVEFSAAGKMLEISVASAQLPQLKMTAAGYLLPNNEVSLYDVASTGDLTINGGFAGSGAAVVIAADMSAKATPITVGAAATLTDPATGLAGVNARGHLKIGSAVKAPAAAVTMNGLLQFTAAPDAHAFQGAVTVGAAGTLQVDAGTVPASDGSAAPATGASLPDMFSNAVSASGSEAGNSAGLKFVSGATLKLGNAAVWARPITVGSFNY